jgi:parallel beta-helix repeat protein
VNEHFIIRNNILYTEDWNSGISLGTISSNNISIINNTIYGSVYRKQFGSGIQLYNVQKCYIYNNSVYSKDIGIKIISSSNCVIGNNSLLHNGRDIDMIDCTEILIANNTLMVDVNRSRYDLPDSIHIANSLNISINSKECKNGGIWFSGDSSSTIILQNNSVNGLDLGFFIDQASLFFDNSHQYGQLILVNCTNCVSFNLSISHCVAGISFYNCSYSNCSSCNFSENYYSGLYIAYSVNLTISDGKFNYNRLDGARVAYSDAIELTGNEFRYNLYGVFVSNSNVIYNNNTFSNNAYQDVRVYDY